jgi:hypothetical protein
MDKKCKMKNRTSNPVAWNVSCLSWAISRLEKIIRYLTVIFIKFGGLYNLDKYVLMCIYLIDNLTLKELFISFLILKN